MCLMRTKATRLTSFNHYPQQTCLLQRPERYRELFDFEKSIIARGQGNSYGDAALNLDGHVLLTERLNRLIAFDETKGTLTAEAGVTLHDILPFIAIKGWFLPVIPGTQYVSLGGCIASDVHGKNHHQKGSFGQHLLWLDLITADKKILRCSSHENADIFWATVGGMGLTGIIGAACIQLLPIKTQLMQVTHHAAKDLMQIFSYLNDVNVDDEYSVAWIDTLTESMRGIVMTAHHAEEVSIIKPTKSHLLTIPGYFPAGIINKTSIKIFNKIYFKRQSQKLQPFIVHYADYFCPLDKIKNWNYLYGKKGFVQYQCVLPISQAYDGIKTLLDYLQSTKYPTFLAVLKRLGAASKGLLSFPMPGFTLALDMPLQDEQLFAVLDKLDEIVLAHNGRVYLAKDARMQPATFRAMYPNYREWLAIKQKIDPNNIFNSSLARRLNLIKG